LDLWIGSVMGTCGCGGWYLWGFEASGCVTIVNVVEGHDGWEDVLEWSGEAIAHVKLVKTKPPFKIFPCGSGGGPYYVCKPIWVVGT